jgi:ribosome-binding factor A
MSRRIDRFNELLRHEISQLLSRQIKDPRLDGIISITRVETSSDLRGAQVFLSVMGDSSVKLDALEGVRSAASFLRRELRHRLTARHTPFLRFALDDSLDEGDQVLRLMDLIREDSGLGPNMDHQADDPSSPLPHSLGTDP